MWQAERTYTEIHPLDQEGRVNDLARIISGDQVTELSRANAREMLGLAESETLIDKFLELCYTGLLLKCDEGNKYLEALGTERPGR